MSSVLTALDIAIAMLSRAAAISSIIATAQGEGRTELTDAEWTMIVSSDDQARADLATAIGRAKQEGR